MDPSLIEVFVFENMQLLEQLEKTLLAAEKNSTLSKEQINDVFRVMHTIKGSASMMEFAEMARYAHALEDMFDFIRSNTLENQRLWEEIFDTVLDGIDFFKQEIGKLQEGQNMDGDSTELYEVAHRILRDLKGDGQATAYAKEQLQAEQEQLQAEQEQKIKASADQYDDVSLGKFKVTMAFLQGSGMETVRALGVVTSLRGLYDGLQCIPANLDDDCDKEISENGFVMLIDTSMTREELAQKLGETILVRSLEIEDMDEQEQDEDYLENIFEAAEPALKAEKAAEAVVEIAGEKAVKQSFISINVGKIDRLMNLVGEIVTTESMVTKSPDIANLKLENFTKQARQLRKLTNELQDVVMSIRMVPISTAFNKMQRVVRDMSKKIDKPAELVIIGETTEVDKNVIDCLNDPLMHLIRNSMDHGLEGPEERLAAGKPPKGTITLEAYNTGGDVIVTVSDDGRGLNKSAIIKKAQDMGLTTKTEEELSDQEAYQFILEPGFSTNKEITEYSGRGVGMDVVHKNIELINGSISIESKQGQGMTNKIHIPLTLAIVDGMVVSVGREQYIIPVLSIRESFEAKNQKIFTDPDGMDMVIIRNECYRVIRLSDAFSIPTEVSDYQSGIIVMIEAESGATCLFVDKLIGEQQAVIKPVPDYIMKNFGRIRGISGCTVLGDGSISMILDTNAFINIR